MSGYASALVSVLSVAIPVLFLGGLLGLRSQVLLWAGSSFTSAAGFVLGCLGVVIGVIHAAGLEQTLLGSTGIGGWWWAPLLAGLALMGLSTLLKVGLRPLAASVLASAALGWVSLLTDVAFPGVLVPIRPVHFASAGLFCLSSVLWGWMLLVWPRSSARTKP